MKSAPPFHRFSLFRVALSVGGLVLGTSGVSGAPYAQGDVIPEVKLKNGTVLHDVKLVAIGATTIMARWPGGQGTIVLAQLPPELRDALVPVAAPKPVAVPARVPAVAVEVASTELPTEIQLTNGFVMHRSEVTRWEEHAVLVSYEGGIAPVQFQNMVPGQRTIFEARKSEALARQAKMDAEQALAHRAATRAALALQAKEGVIPEVKMKDGTVYYDFRILAVHERSIEARWRGMPEIVALNQLPPELQARWRGGRDNVARSQLPPELQEALDPTSPNSVAASEPAPAATDLPTAIKLTNGFVMQQSRVMRWNKGSVLVRYQGGTVPVQFNNIVPEQRAIFVARESEALAQQAKQDVEQAAAHSKAEPAERGERLRAMWEAGEIEVHTEPPPGMSRAELAKIERGTNPPQPWDDPDPEAIRQAISNHQLVKGMTKEEVRQSIGVPQTGYEENSATYIYLDRGRDKYGNHVVRTLWFNQDDILTGWFDKRDSAPMSEAIFY